MSELFRVVQGEDHDPMPETESPMNHDERVLVGMAATTIGIGALSLTMIFGLPQEAFDIARDAYQDMVRSLHVHPHA